jgi:phosphatidylinositol alpha-mannosyltransferase
VTNAGLHVALLNFAYWPEVQRGNERIVHDLAGGLAKRGNQVSVVTSHPSRPRRTSEDGVDVVRLWRPPDRLLTARRIQENLTHVPSAYLELRRSRPQIGHAFFITDALATSRWAGRYRGKSVYTMTGIAGRHNVSNVRGRRRLFEIATRCSDAVTVLSEAAQDQMWRWLGVEAHVIYPGVDTTRFTPGDRAPVPTIACAADPADPRKRVDLLVRAFSRVKADRPDAELLLVEPTDSRLASQLSLVPGVRLLSRGPETAAAMFRAAWASALCSYAEAFGLVVIESLACGTPVVGTRDGAIPEIVDRPERGVLFAGDDEREVARALLDGLELGGDAATSAACVDRAQCFSVERTTDAHEALYREVLSS